MNLNLGFELNETITVAVIERVRLLDRTLAGASEDEIVRKSSAARLLGAIGDLTSIPVFLKINDFVNESLLAEFDPQLLNRGMFSPLCEDDDCYYIALANPWDPSAEDACALRRPDKRIVKILAPAAEINQVIETISGTSGPSRSELDAIEVEESSDVVGDFEVTREYTEPLAQLVALMMYEGIKRRASDIHIRCGKDDIHYCYRIDGDLGYKYELPNKLKNRIDAFLLNLMGISPEERMKRPGISGRFTVSYLRRSIDIRFERHRTYRGYHATMRILDKSHFEAKLGMGSLAFDPATLFEIDKVMAIPSGIIVMSGPTGSGKSTTLNAMLRELNRPEDNILTLENPVEDEIPGVVHCDLKDASEFKPMITSFMRSDPDIILMGEVRDLDSAELAIEAAITGHKVLTTIHTPRASQIIERFEQLGVERWKIAQTLKAACAQRLVKMLCPFCKIEQKGLSELEVRKYSLNEEWLTHTLWRAGPDGCNECNNKGYMGRTAILEIIPITAEWSNALSQGKMSPYELELEVRSQGVLPSLRDSGIALVKSGHTDFEAIRKVIDMTGN